MRVSLSDVLLEAMATAVVGLAIGCTTTVIVREWRAPRVLVVQLDASCHIADTIRVEFDGRVVVRRVMQPLDAYETTVSDGTHTVSARVLSSAPSAWVWPLIDVTVPPGQRHVDRLIC